MNKISRIYYINLDRRPDRNEHFLKECSKKRIDTKKIVRFPALDGNIYKFSREELDLFKNVDYRNKEYNKKIMGNQLSHYYILKDMIKNNYEYIIIFQDDVIFRKDFIMQLEKVMYSLPKDTEIVNIAFHKFASYENFIPWNLDQTSEDQTMSKKNITKGICILNDTINPCSLGYIVTLNGAKNLIEHFDTNGFYRATDWNFNMYLIEKNIFYGSRIVLCTGNPSLGSDIFK